MSHYFVNDPQVASQSFSFSTRLRGTEVTVTSDHGVFSNDRLDKGTKVLLEYVPDPPTAGTFVDLGCGWGPITLALALAAPGATVYGIDVNDRARELTQSNAKQLGLKNVRTATAEAFGDQAIDVLWSNPPIRIGKKPAQELLAHWLGLLSTSGVAYLVINKNLGADTYQKFLTGLGYDVSRLATSGGFRVFEVRHAH